MDFVWSLDLVSDLWLWSTDLVLKTFPHLPLVFSCANFAQNSSDWRLPGGQFRSQLEQGRAVWRLFTDVHFVSLPRYLDAPKGIACDTSLSFSRYFFLGASSSKCEHCTRVTPIDRNIILRASTCRGLGSGKSLQAKRELEKIQKKGEKPSRDPSHCHLKAPIPNRQTCPLVQIGCSLLYTWASCPLSGGAARA